MRPKVSRAAPADEVDEVDETQAMRLALRLARRAYGQTSPNPLVGAVLVHGGRIIGQGWHHRAGQPHAEVEALRDAARRGRSPRGATLFVTLEPCSTFGRTPPCTDAIVAAGIRKVVVAATDPNPAHAGRGLGLLRSQGIEVTSGLLAAESARMNEPFDHWIVHRTPFVTVKAAMTLDGKIATADGRSKWITGDRSRAHGQRLRRGSDAILVGIGTVLADDPSLTVRSGPGSKVQERELRRLVLDTRARTPLTAKLVTDGSAGSTTIFVGQRAAKKRVAALSERVRVVVAPEKDGHIDLGWLLPVLGLEGVTSLLVEGGGEVNAAFLLGGFAHRVAFFYAPMVLGGCDALRGVAGEGARSLAEALSMVAPEWRRFGPDLFMTARVASPPATGI